MTYKKHLVFLLTLIGVMALIYTAGIVFSYDRASVRSASYIWLDSRDAARINRIVFNTYWDVFELVNRNNQWFVSRNGNEFPAPASCRRFFKHSFNKSCMAYARFNRRRP